jgi:hypothetical protein
MMGDGLREKKFRTFHLTGTTHLGSWCTGSHQRWGLEAPASIFTFNSKALQGFFFFAFGSTSLHKRVFCQLKDLSVDHMAFALVWGKACSH